MCIPWRINLGLCVAESITTLRIRRTEKSLFSRIYRQRARRPGLCEGTEFCHGKTNRTHGNSSEREPEKHLPYFLPTVFPTDQTWRETSGENSHSFTSRVSRGIHRYSNSHTREKSMQILAFWILRPSQWESMIRTEAFPEPKSPGRCLGVWGKGRKPWKLGKENQFACLGLVQPSPVST